MVSKGSNDPRLESMIKDALRYDPEKELTYNRIFLRKHELRLGNLVWLRGEAYYVRELMNEKVFLSKFPINPHYDLEGVLTSYDGLEPIFMIEILDEDFFAKIGFEDVEFTEDEKIRDPVISKGTIRRFRLQLELSPELFANMCLEILWPLNTVFSLTIQSNKGTDMKEEQNSISCQHITLFHQFQNLCFGLTGKEIEVEAEYVQTKIKNFYDKRQPNK